MFGVTEDAIKFWPIHSTIFFRYIICEKKKVLFFISYGGVHGLSVIVVGSGVQILDTNILEEGMNLTIHHPTIGK